ncbi:hypothetical protein [Pararcticibacter amylolyticus]|uniref:Uncharacterized protein n=1 Tax=Pararcticibacter amylolyticus TaxID=2173175 RepID=A0A2U2PA13_9SPHI|nr:hypothetical protein [Pararcticibacter amylolyticus]PWG78185.1 hypothetical protein DDR33_23550 [Pararcticibacter amylolyticus]
MKFNLRPVLLPALALLAFFANAQTELKTIPDVKFRINNNRFTGKAEAAVVNFGNGTTIALTGDNKGENYAVVSLTPDYQFKWKTAISGEPFCIARLGDKVIVAAATDKSYFKSYTNQYLAFLIDPASGKVLMQKEIYNGSKDFMEYPQFYTSESGKFFKFSVRVTSVKRKVHIGLPGIGSLVTMKRLEDQASNLQGFALISVNEKLETKRVDPVLSRGRYFKSVSNENGDVFLFTMKDKASFQISRYEEGAKEAAKTIDQSLGGELKNLLAAEGVKEEVLSECDGTNPLSVYWAMMVNAGKGTTLLLSKLNFADGTSRIAEQLFTNDKLKELKKQFKEINKDVDQVDMGSSESVALHSLRVFGDRVLVTTGSETVLVGGNSANYNYSSEVVSSFGKDLTLNYQLVLPNRFYVKGPAASYGKAELNRTGDVVRFIANADKGMASFNGIYGEFNAENGQMLKLAVIPRGKADKAAFIDGRTIIWSDKGYTLQFCELNGWTGSEKEVTLKQYAY